MKYADLCRTFIKKQEGNYDYFYRRHVETVVEANASGETRYKCVFHADKAPGAASYNKDTGLWKCFSDCQTGGDVFGFWARLNRVWSETMDVEDVARSLAISLGIVEEINDQMVESHHQALLSSSTAINTFMQQTQLSLITIKRFKLGFVKNRLSIPITGERGYWEDIRLYDRENKIKILSWKTGHGAPRVFPFSVLKSSQRVVLFEGEKDCMRAHQCGISDAITITSGSGSLPEDYARLFHDKTVYICYDCDEAGTAGARSVADKLSLIARETYIVALPKDDLPEKGDFTDWANIVGDQHVPQLFAKLLSLAERISSVRKAASPSISHEDIPAEDATYKQLSAEGNYRKRLKLLTHVIGASAGLKHYQLPHDLSVHCTRDRGRMCAGCSVYATPAAEMPHRVVIDQVAEETLQLIRFSKVSQLRTIKRLIGVPDRCDVCQIVEESRSAVQVLLLSEPVELGTMREGVSGFKTAFYHGAPIQDNRDYYVTGYVHADPKTQESVINCESAEPARSALEDFKCDEATRHAIEYFQPKNNHTIAEHYHWILTRMEEMTGIYGRHDVSSCVLSSMYSALEFTIGNKKVDSGWVDSLIVGDTRTGKSEMVRRMMKIIDVGEFISCENMSLAGLLGGIQIIDGTMIPVWGKWPQNDRGFVALDEITEISGGSHDIMGKLSTMRSSGVAEINKIQQARTSARVRSVHVANPVGGVLISSFDAGVRAINGVIRHPEDVARFTCATIVSQATVDVSTILQDTPTVDFTAMGKQMNLLALLTWSLIDHQVVFSLAAVTALREAVTRLSIKYHPSIPLWENGSGFVKLARLSVSVAVLCGSFKIDAAQEATLHISEEHSRYAVSSLERLYDSSSMGYDRLSRHEFERETLRDSAAVMDAMTTDYASGSSRALQQYFLMSDELTRNSLSELMGFRQQAEAIWSTLLVNHALVVSRSKRDTYVKTPAFVRLLEQIARDPEGTLEIVKRYNAQRVLEDHMLRPDDGRIRVSR